MLKWDPKLELALETLHNPASLPGIREPLHIALKVAGLVYLIKQIDYVKVLNIHSLCQISH